MYFSGIQLVGGHDCSYTTNNMMLVDQTGLGGVTMGECYAHVLGNTDCGDSTILLSYFNFNSHEVNILCGVNQNVLAS